MTADGQSPVGAESLTGVQADERTGLTHGTPRHREPAVLIEQAGPARPEFPLRLRGAGLPIARLRDFARLRAGAARRSPTGRRRSVSTGPNRPRGRERWGAARA
ncbi:hypothetical protein, partial [Streptomyces sp. WG7]|uniref:hypothetical protein n=1 Tax=Streptomyces sp. WG7 TaxID=3417650 RepID=UPI003CE86D2E